MGRNVKQETNVIPILKNADSLFDSNKSTLSTIVPSTVAGENVYFLTSGDIRISDAYGVTKYDVAVGSMAAGTTYTFGQWFDTANDELWFVGANTDRQTCYLSKINLVTGAYTNIGSADLGVANVFPAAHTNDSGIWLERQNESSGDFYLYSLSYRFTLSASTGGLLATDTVYHPIATSVALSVSEYRTEDNKLRISVWAFSSGSLSLTLTLSSPYGAALYVLPTDRGDIPFSTSTGNNFFNLWNSQYICFGGNGTASLSVTGGGGRMFLRSEFDAWLKKLADYRGLRYE